MDSRPIRDKYLKACHIECDSIKRAGWWNQLLQNAFTSGPIRRGAVHVCYIWTDVPYRLAPIEEAFAASRPWRKKAAEEPNEE